MYSDPPGAKIGCGGATMHVIEQLEKTVAKSELEQGTYIRAYVSMNKI